MRHQPSSLEAVLDVSISFPYPWQQHKGKLPIHLSRLLALTILLINRRRVTAPELAKRFGVTVRTIYRDIEALRGADIPVVGCQRVDASIEMIFTIENDKRVCSWLPGFGKEVEVLAPQSIRNSVSAEIAARSDYRSCNR